jgi:hypothetical protein|tara:strand:- start:3246 stop:3470 length:225 start_codon:yes stop_codon:yes gene_type:complete
MTRTDLQYELNHHYKSGRFARNAMFIDSKGRSYYPICIVGEDELLIDVGGTDRQVPLGPHLQDELNMVRIELKN